MKLVHRRNESEIHSLPVLVVTSIFCIRCLGCIKEQSDDQARTTDYSYISRDILDDEPNGCYFEKEGFL